MMNALEHRLPPPGLALLIALAMIAVAWFRPPGAVDPVLRYGLAGVLFILAGVFGPTAFGRFRKAKTTASPVAIDQVSSLVTEGIYRYSRNPMYVSVAALLASLAAGLAVPWTALGPVVFVLFITRFQIIPEERVLLAKFGQAYERYRSRVRRWL
jgi:protein-S-isoprenylcysteine O-methyltransferase Ste14